MDLGNLGPRDFDDYIRRDDLQAKMVFRAAFRRSLYLVAKVITSWNEPRNLMSADTFKERQDWIQWIVSDKKRGLLEDPRGMIKSSGCTRTVPLWLLIQRPDEDMDHPNEFARARDYLVAHLHVKGPDTRILILGDSESNAARFTGSTLNILNTNPLLRWCFPEFIWPNVNRRSYKCEYNAREWTPAGRLNETEPNAFVRAAGSETAIVGGRSDVTIFNDLIGEHNCNSPTEILRQRDFVKTAPFLLEDRDPESPSGGVAIVEGNRWLLDDVNSLIHDEFHDWAIWRRSVLRCYVHGAGSCGRWGSDEAKACGPTQVPTWPERYPDMESIERVIRDIADPAKVAAQLFNDPTKASDLDPARMRPFYVEVRPVRDDRGKLSREWCAVVPVAAGGEEILPLAALDPHVISIDPAASDEPGSARTAILWAARDRVTGRRLWIDCVADRWAADSGKAEAAIVDMIEMVHERTGRMPRLAIEKVAAQGYLASAIVHLARARKLRISEPELIKPVKGLAKDDRIRRRIGFVLSQDLLLVRAGLQLPRTEARHFPTGTKDVLDAGGQAEEVFGSYRGKVMDDDRRDARRAARERRIAQSGVTGAPL